MQSRAKPGLGKREIHLPAFAYHNQQCSVNQARGGSWNMCSMKRSWSGPQRVCCTFQGFAPWWPVLALTFFFSGLQTILTGCATRPEDYCRLMSVCTTPSAFSKKLELIQLIAVCRVTWPRRNMPHCVSFWAWMTHSFYRDAAPAILEGVLRPR